MQASSYIPPTTRAPLRDISPPPPTLHDDDIDMEPRRRLPATSFSNEHHDPVSNDSRPIKPLPSHQLKQITKLTERDHRGSHCNAKQPKVMNQSIAQRRHSKGTAASSAFPSGQPLRNREKRSSLDFDLLDQVDNDENMPQRPSTSKGKKRVIYPSDGKRIPSDDSSDYGMDDENDFADASFLATLDKVERDALRGKASSSTQLISKIDGGNRGSCSSQTFSPTERPISSFAARSQVIEIDDEDPDKENAFVPMRHVRRRTEDYKESPRGRSPTSQKWIASQDSTQKNVKPTVASDNVIDISDSE